MAPKSKRPLDCKVCGKVFAYHHTLLRHHRSVHLKVRYPCPDCGKTFSDTSGVLVHRKLTHLRMRTQCEHCSRPFRTARALRLHSATCEALMRHIQESDPTQALVQQVERAKRAKARLEKRREQARKRAVSPCQVCKKVFKTQVAKERHLMEVHDIRHFVCEEGGCGRTFSSKGALLSHIKVSHELLRYQCPYCDKQLCARRNMMNHVVSAHGQAALLGMEEVGMERVPFVLVPHQRETRCLVCGCYLAGEEEVEEHMRASHLDVMLERDFRLPDFRLVELGSPEAHPAPASPAS
jgi:DNA-directed RNA polymerase subunit RPC12/RpoP